MLNNVCRTLVMVSAFIWTTSALAQPVNDNCASATAIGDGTVSASNAGATNDGTASCQPDSSADIWFKYTAPVSGTARFETCGSTLTGGGSMDTVLSIFSSCGGPELGCDDDAGCINTFTSKVQLNITQGTNYLVRVAGRSGVEGNIQLHVSSVASGGSGPVNDLCQAPTDVAEGTFTGSNVGAGTDYFATCAGDTGADVWWRYTATQTGTVDVETCGSSFDTVLTAFELCGESELACNDNAVDCGTGGSRVTFGTTQGADYFLRVAGVDGATGDITLHIALQGTGNNNNNNNTNGNNNNGNDNNTNGNTNNNNDNTGGNTNGNDNTGANTNDNTGGNTNGNDNSAGNNNSGGNVNPDTNSDGTVDAGEAAAAACGSGACGAGTAQLMPLTVLGLCGLKLRRVYRRK